MMTGNLYWLLLAFLFFVLLPAVALSIIAVIRFFYGKMQRRKNIGVPRLIVSLAIAVLGLAIIPPLAYIASESATGEITVTGNIATLTADESNSDVRYITYNGEKYQELETSISDSLHYELSDTADIDYGNPVANAIWEDQSFIEKYITETFKYAPYSQPIYPVTKTGMSDCISLAHTSLFCHTDSIDDRLAYYGNTENYDYFAQDYNTDAYYNINTDDASMDEISNLAYLKYDREYDDTEESIVAAIPNIRSLKVDSDYDMFTIIGESKDKLILREVGEIYIDDNDMLYQCVEELWNDDGSVTLMALPVSSGTTAKLLPALRR